MFTTHKLRTILTELTPRLLRYRSCLFEDYMTGLLQIRRLNGNAGVGRAGFEAKTAAHALPPHVPAPRHAPRAPPTQQARVNQTPHDTRTLLVQTACRGSANETLCHESSVPGSCEDAYLMRRFDIRSDSIRNETDLW